MKIITIPLFLAAILFTACKENKKESNKISSISSGRFINPPMANADIPFEEFKIDAAKGDTLFYKSGSIILFPANSLVDGAGKIINGNVNIKYREFRTPIDFYLSGIPMNYDSAGVSHTFESSGMFEILAFKDSVPVFVNTESKPEVIMTTENQSTDHRIYYLDTIQKKWIYKGVSVVTDISKHSPEVLNNSEKTNSGVAEIIKPKLAVSNRPLITIKIDTSSFEELMVYDNLKFQISDDEANFNPSDADELWSNVLLSKQKQNGKYKVTFSNAKRTISYNVTPVFEGEDYKKALLIYERKLKTSESLKRERLLNENKQKTKFIEDSLANQIVIEENKRIDRMNRLIEARNKEIEWQNRITERENERAKNEEERRKKENERLKKEQERNMERGKVNQFARSITVTQFGVWNSDKPIVLDVFSLAATFVDSLGNTLDVKDIAVASRSFNVILRSESNTVRVHKNGENMIIGMANGRLVYISFTEYQALGITANTRSQVFKMNILSNQNNNYGYIQSLISK